VGYRKLEPTDYAAVGNDIQRLAQYYSVIGVAQDLFGPNVYKVELELDGDSDDEGGMSYRVQHISASDKDGNRLYYDPDATGWKYIFTEGQTARYREPGEGVFDPTIYTPGDELHYALDEEFSDDLYDYRRRIEVTGWYDFDDEIIVEKLPKVKYNDLYVLEEEV
jgi:hypothetical protein